MTKLIPEDIQFSEVGHLPIVKDFAKKIKLVETIDAMVDSQMDLKPGITVLAMVLDTLSGRTPLYRLEEFFQEKDTELILGHDVKPELFCDYNVSRVLDKLFDTGTQKIFSQIAQNAIGIFDIDPRRVHFDTTSISVFGDYDFIDPPLNITYGHSKDKRPAANYRGYETIVEIDGESYRAIVVHSSAHDKRRHKRIDRLLQQKRKETDATCKNINSDSFFCRADAEAAADKIKKAVANSYHRVEYEVRKEARYPRGRPAKGKVRTPTGYEYIVDVKIDMDADAIAPLRLEAGCFVLICNLSSKQERKQWTAISLLKLYKDQGGIEQNFGFLKDPVIVNSIFLKKPSRIEVLGLVLLIALLIWRLMERCMRRYLDETGSEITGWKNKPTKRPTSFMMTTKFLSILVARAERKRQLVRPLRPVQIEYLQALGVNPEVFVDP